MSYCANYDGTITFKDAPTRSVRDFIDTHFTSYYDEKRKEYSIGAYSEYNEDELYELFEITHGMIENGEIDFEGEDGSLWRFIYLPAKEAWDEQYGHIVYESCRLH